MRTVNLGGLDVSALGYGCMGITHAYGPALDDAEGIRILHAAIDEGYTFLDTAESYGPHLNEELVGKALADRRDAVILATKCGVYLEHGDHGAPIPDGRPDVIRQSIEGSLARLGTDHVDLYYQHRIDPYIPAEDVAGVMGELIAEGKILHWGISEATEDYLRAAHAVTPVSAIENRYSMMARDYEALFPTLNELGIGLVAFSPLANGYLSGKYDHTSTFGEGDYRAGMPQFSEEATNANHQLLELIAGLAEQFGATSAQISLAWMMSKATPIVPIPGTTKPARLKENARAAEIRLSPVQVQDLDAALDRVGMSAVFGGSARTTKP